MEGVNDGSSQPDKFIRPRANSYTAGAPYKMLMQRQSSLLKELKNRFPQREIKAVPVKQTEPSGEGKLEVTTALPAKSTHPFSSLIRRAKQAVNNMRFTKTEPLLDQLSLFLDSKKAQIIRLDQLKTMQSNTLIEVIGNNSEAKNPQERLLSLAESACNVLFKKLQESSFKVIQEFITHIAGLKQSCEGEKEVLEALEATLRPFLEKATTLQDVVNLVERSPEEYRELLIKCLGGLECFEQLKQWLKSNTASNDFPPIVEHNERTEFCKSYVEFCQEYQWPESEEIAAIFARGGEDPGLMLSYRVRQKCQLRLDQDFVAVLQKNNTPEGIERVEEGPEKYSVVRTLTFNYFEKSTYNYTDPKRSAPVFTMRLKYSLYYDGGWKSASMSVLEFTFPPKLAQEKATQVIKKLYATLN